MRSVSKSISETNNQKLMVHKNFNLMPVKENYSSFCEKTTHNVEM